jgi:hypothetical protein
LIGLDHPLGDGQPSPSPDLSVEPYVNGKNIESTNPVGKPPQWSLMSIRPRPAMSGLELLRALGASPNQSVRKKLNVIH